MQFIFVIKAFYPHDSSQSQFKALAASITKDFVMKASRAGVGILFYWEPEVYGDWRPKSYTTFFDNWPVYDMGAFSANGRPTSVLKEWSK